MYVTEINYMCAIGVNYICTTGVNYTCTTGINSVVPQDASWDVRWKGLLCDVTQRNHAI